VNYTMTREALQRNAQLKLDDSKILFQNGSYSNAYYFAGYVIEIGLKACIARHFLANVIPDKKLVNDAYSHDFDKLLGVAGLRGDLKKSINENVAFEANWGIVSQWNPDSRYEQTDRSTAQYFLHAIEDQTNGVFKWIIRHW
jgi:HEPN domain-containing protein